MLLVSLWGLAMVFVAVTHRISWADEAADVRGEVINGTEGSEVSVGLEVLLHRFGDQGQIEVLSTLTQEDGSFIFESVKVGEGSSYAVATSFQDVLYSAAVPSPIGAERVELTVYDVVRTIDAITIDAHVMFINEGAADGSLSVLEAVGVVNDGDRTFVAELEQPTNFNFMRFSLPQGYSDLDVKSDLPGGEVINIGTGFAFTAPVTPGSHQVNYSYQLAYSNGSVLIEKSFHMGAEEFRLLLREGLGHAAYEALDEQAPLETVEIGGLVYTSRELSDLTVGGRVSFLVSGLPTRSWWGRAGETLTEGSVLKIGIPSTLAVVLVALLGIGLIASYKRAKEPAAAEMPPAPEHGFVEEMHSMNEDQLVQRIADLDDLHAGGGIGEKEYRAARQAAKEHLLRMVLDSDASSESQREKVEGS